MEWDRDFDGPFHGKKGPIGVRRLFPDIWPGYTVAIMNAAKAEGFDYFEDHNFEAIPGVIDGDMASLNSPINIMVLTIRSREYDYYGNQAVDNSETNEFIAT